MMHWPCEGPNACQQCQADEQAARRQMTKVIVYLLMVVFGICTFLSWFAMANLIGNAFLRWIS